MSDEEPAETPKTVVNEVARKQKGITKESDRAVRPGFRNPANTRSKASRKKKKKGRK